jgi:hypothetical protein
MKIILKPIKDVTNWPLLGYAACTIEAAEEKLGPAHSPKDTIRLMGRSWTYEALGLRFCIYENSQGNNVVHPLLHIKGTSASAVLLIGTLLDLPASRLMLKSAPDPLFFSWLEQQHPISTAWQKKANPALRWGELANPDITPFPYSVPVGPVHDPPVA